MRQNGLIRFLNGRIYRTRARISGICATLLENPALAAALSKTPEGPARGVTQRREKTPQNARLWRTSPLALRGNHIPEAQPRYRHLLPQM